MDVPISVHDTGVVIHPVVVPAHEQPKVDVPHSVISVISEQLVGCATAFSQN